ncbi:hypothetical protein D3C72_2437000 [compost metagenome]
MLQHSEIGGRGMRVGVFRRHRRGLRPGLRNCRNQFRKQRLTFRLADGHQAKRAVDARNRAAVQIAFRRLSQRDT